jgi:hypothetical protein
MHPEEVQMTTCIGFVLLITVLSGGVFLYFKVENLNKEIEKQATCTVVEGEDENG